MTTELEKRVLEAAMKNHRLKKEYKEFETDALEDWNKVYEVHDKLCAAEKALDAACEALTAMAFDERGRSE